jgi:hypothetical protein
MTAPQVNTGDVVKVLLIAIAVIAVLLIVYFTIVKPVGSVIAATPGGVLPFGLGALAGGMFANKFLGNKAVEPTGDPNAATASEGAAGEQGAANAATSETAADTGSIIEDATPAVEDAGTAAFEGMSAEDLLFLGIL